VVERVQVHLLDQDSSLRRLLRGLTKAAKPTFVVISGHLRIEELIESLCVSSRDELEQNTVVKELSLMHKTSLFCFLQ
jgi:hypothetical protein